ncbi:16603_t:CDS:1, partial [Entrophospora sp. SA101]
SEVCEFALLSRRCIKASGTDNLFISPTTIDKVTNSEIANNNSTKPVGWLFKMTGAWVVDYNFSGSF